MVKRYRLHKTLVTKTEVIKALDFKKLPFITQKYAIFS